MQAKPEAENLDLRQLRVARRSSPCALRAGKAKLHPLVRSTWTRPVLRSYRTARARGSVRSERAPRRSASAIMTARSSLMNSTPLAIGLDFAVATFTGASSIYFDIFYVERDTEGLH